MPNQNFSNFAERTTGILDSDYIIGYDPAGPLEFRTTVGNLLSGGSASENIHYTLWLGHQASAAVNDATSYYWGQLLDLGLVTSPAVSRSVYIANSNIIKYASVAIYVGGTLGSAEPATLKVANISDGTESVITNNATYSVQNQGTLYTLASPLAVSQSDQICIKWETPTWATNPSAIRHMINLYMV
jgi:hypothetical protein